jgi:hypothetical protein
VLPQVGRTSHKVMRLKLAVHYVPPEEIALPGVEAPRPELMPMGVPEYFVQNGAQSNFNQYIVCNVARASTDLLYLRTIA